VRAGQLLGKIRASPAVAVDAFVIAVGGPRRRRRRGDSRCTRHEALDRSRGRSRRRRHRL